MVSRTKPGHEHVRRSGAIYSACGRYRYSLWREWNAALPTLLWIMLNPSTADHLGNNDPTIERCERRTRDWGYGRIEVVNLFALRSTDPAALRRDPDPVGPENDAAIRDLLTTADATLCAWGALGGRNGRAAAVLGLAASRPLTCLGLTKDGHPAHPLYLPYGRLPIPFRP